MKLVSSTLRLSATDLANHLACPHLTALDRGSALGLLKPPHWNRPDQDVLAERGLEHERQYLEYLEAQGKTITRLDAAGEGASAIERTLRAMYSGAEVIAQATLVDDRWLGRADVLVRVPRPSPLGAWSYEALDTKLARDTKAGAVLQLCLYSELLAAMQGVIPERMHVVPRRPGFPLDSYRLDDYAAYYRFVRRRLGIAVDAESAAATYPEPVPHCDICRWRPACDRQRRDDDHLSLVAGISKLQRRELVSRTIETLARLAVEPIPVAWKPARGSRPSYDRVREQARVQLQGRIERRHLHELLPIEPGRGLAHLPAPSPGDVFLDLEADPYVDDGGLEYLFGWIACEHVPGALALEAGAPVYHREWALDRAAEKRVFEHAIDAIMARWAADPNMHVYHYGAYEPAALKRLMGRHATREAEMDRLLRGERLVDLHAVVKQALRASVEEYSIKRLEPLFGYRREQPLEDAGAALRVIARSLELGAAIDTSDSNARTVEAYNRDDCVATLELRDWLERLRAEVVAGGADVPRPVLEAGDPSAAIGDRERQAKELAERLLAGVPDERLERTDPQHARWLLAHMLDWHRREEKAPWWEYYRLRELVDEDLFDEKAALAGLEFVERVPGEGKAIVDRYRFPVQDTSIREESELELTGPEGGSFGEVVAIDMAARTVDIKKKAKCADVHPTSVFAHKVVGAAVIAQALMRLGQWVADHDIDADGPYRAARDLLLGLGPRLVGHAGGALRAPGESPGDAARRLALALDRGALAIQGPPGSGKTYTGARMICDLVRAKRRIGVCAQSHKVIRNLLAGVVSAAAAEGLEARCLQKCDDEEAPGIAVTGDNAAMAGALRSREVDVAGGTAWLWARDDMADAVDILFVDEAGQMSLANVLAISQCAKSIVLLGDPRQLEQPIQGSHPEGTEVSALDHVLGKHLTIPDDRGLFLAETWRLPPEICAFTSEMFYERRLEPHPTATPRALSGAGAFDGAGLWYVPVHHDANQSASAEEVEVVAGLIGSLLDRGVHWRDRDGVSQPLAVKDILVIAPYNAQVADLAARLPEGVRVGTVDRFQGQEAPLVIYSLTTSTAEDAPRGMDFLYDPNRFNVATSRAMCACIVVGSPRLFAPDCQSPKHMKLANVFCRFREVAREVRLDEPTAAPAV